MFMAPVSKHSDPTYEMLVSGALATGPVYRRSQIQQKVGWPLINWSISGLDKQTLSMHVPAVGSGEAKEPDRNRMWLLVPSNTGTLPASHKCSELDLPVLDRPNAPRCFHWTRTQHPPAIFSYTRRSLNKGLPVSFSAPQRERESTRLVLEFLVISLRLSNSGEPVENQRTRLDLVKWPL